MTRRPPVEVIAPASAGAFLTAAPFLAQAAGAATEYGLCGAAAAACGVGAVPFALETREMPTVVAACGVGAAAWGTWSAWACWSDAPTLSRVAIGAFLTLASAAAGAVVSWRREGTPIERTKLEIERAKLDLTVAKADDWAARHESPQDDTVSIEPLPEVRWAGPRVAGAPLDTIEISPGCALPVDAHILIGGTTGGGKSGITDLIMCSLIPRFSSRVVAVDMKPGAPELGLYARAGVRVVTGTKDAAALIAWLNEEVDRRGAEMQRLTQETGRKHASWVPTAEDPYLFVVIDELTELLDTLDRDGRGAFYRLLRLSRAYAFTMVCATQSPRAKMFGEDAGASGRGQFGVRVCLATKQSSETRLIIDDLAYEPGWKDAHRMPKKGHFMIDTDPVAVIRRAYLAGDDMVSDLIEGFAAGAVQEPAAVVEERPFIPAQRPGERHLSLVPAAGPRNQEEEVLLFLRENGSSSRTTIVGGTTVPTGSVGKVLQRLAEAGCVVKSGNLWEPL
jgi:FtsK/SpoIIIE family